MKLSETFTDELRELLASRGVSVQAFALLADRDVGEIWDILDKKKPADLELVQRVNELFGCVHDWEEQPFYSRICKRCGLGTET